MIKLENVKRIIDYLQNDKEYNELGNKDTYRRILHNFTEYNDLDIIFDNESFIIEYDNNIESFLLRTSFSNQLVDDMFIHTINILKNRVETINSMIND